MLVSVGALLSIVAVLFAFDGKPMTRWKAIAQPNTVVSALSTLAKSSMLMVIGQALGQLKWQHFESHPRRLIDFEIFDSASRGPWGALELLYRIHWRALAGSTGAIGTVLGRPAQPQQTQAETRAAAQALATKRPEPAEAAADADDEAPEGPAPSAAPSQPSRQVQFDDDDLDVPDFLK